LYNLPSALHADEDEKGTRGQVNKLTDIVIQISTRNHLLTITSNGKGKRPASNKWGGRSGSNRSLTDSDGADEQFKVSGYEVVPDDFETDDGTWRLIGKVQHRNYLHFSIHDVTLTIVLQPPPNIRMLYRRSDPNKTEYIAKHVREGSNELAIHEYLHTRRSHSPHVVSLIEVIPSTTREWLILPKLHPIHDQWFMNSGGVAGRVLLGWGLIKGLAYLHEHRIAHRDIKPDNLIRDQDFLLKIIDFDVAIKVRMKTQRSRNTAAQRAGQRLK
jgi:serine/threonine protein kinase